MKPALAPRLEPTAPGPSPVENDSDVQIDWYWAGGYKRLAKKGTSQSTSKKDLLYEVLGHCSICVNPRIVPRDMLSPINPGISPPISSEARESVWVLNHTAMGVIADMLWKNLPQPPSFVVLVKESASFPYQQEDGTRSFVRGESSAPMDNKEYVKCYQCRAVLLEEKMRQHVGTHILHATHGVAESWLVELAFFPDLRLFPFHASACIWKYNFDAHIQAAHSGTPILDTLKAEINIANNENEAVWGKWQESDSGQKHATALRIR
ncbi:hypothetical protein BOTBODRAFT_49572 [Botryobasidium botryosum FD-172 SS1]|uniref:Uncharacterized protein n=1 Tax=Botryobasidium botryosum (strain FD-172 SS1) TaxID=930990 RepID=A0A067M2F8_BOTB1|nr:hypothetical protein BOTBODRAFT_49572 [Botryobasidium botryosum FD-172 SS1]